MELRLGFTRVRLGISRFPTDNSFIKLAETAPCRYGGKTGALVNNTAMRSVRTSSTMAEAVNGE